MLHNSSWSPKEKKIPQNKAKVTPRNVWAVIQAWFRKKQLHLDGIGLEQYMFEQIIWRRIQVRAKSPGCWQSGECIVCGCEILGKTMEDRACSAGEVGREPCYPDMMDKEAWKEYKKLNRIKLFD